MAHLSIRDRLLLALRVLTIAVSIATICLYFGVHAHGQARLSATDAVQDARIADLSASKDALDKALETEQGKVEGLEGRVSTIQGIGIGAMAALGILQGVQVVLQLRKKP